MTVAYILMLALFVLLAVDWGQTLTIAREPERFREAWNVILPRHPTVAQVHAYFAAVWLLATLVLWLVPELQLVIAGVGCAIEAAAVFHNLRLGIRP